MISMKEEPIKKKSSIVLEITMYIAVLLICIYIVPKYVIQRTLVDGQSMQTTLMNGENLLVEKVSYRFCDPSRNDIIVFYPHGRGTDDYYVKRVIGLPNETVQIVDQTIFIDGQKIEDAHASSKMDYAGTAAEGIKLKEDEYFVLGDNRLVSADSRSEDVGVVNKSKIDGRVMCRIWPLSKFGTIK